MSAKTTKLKIKSRMKHVPDPVNALYKAVQRYVKANKGVILVIGGVQVIEWPGDGPWSYTVGIKCLGKKPEYAQKKR